MEMRFWAHSVFFLISVLGCQRPVLTHNVDIQERLTTDPQTDLSRLTFYKFYFGKKMCLSNIEATGL